jgi:hypothetical protein
MKRENEKIFTMEKFENKLKKVFGVRKDRNINYLMSELIDIKTKEPITKDNFKEYGFMDYGNIIMFFCDDYNIFLNVYLTFDVQPTKKPILDYVTVIKKDYLMNHEIHIEVISKYSTEYLIKLIDVLNVTYEAVNIQIKTDFPMTLTTINKNTDLIMGFIIAPRCETD